MARCPNCRNPLEPQNLGIGVSYLCDSCGGAAIGISALKNRNALKSFVDSIWQLSRSRPVFGRKLCPFCQQIMVKVEKDINGGTLDLDICNKCMMVWFDKGEQEKFPKNIDGEELSFRKLDDLSPESREALAVFEFKESKKQEKIIELESDPPEGYLKKIITLLGFPVSSGGIEYSRPPFVLIGITLAIALVYVFDVFNGHILVNNWGLTPGHWYRYYGLNFISSFFVHANFAHILYNLYFFILFGRKVEHDLGKLRFALLLFSSHLFGIFCHFVLHVNSSLPVVGASAGISGIMAYYAFLFPYDKIYLCYLIYLWPYWLRFSIRLYFALHVTLQVLGVIKQFTVGSSIAYTAHLGGIFIGIVMALWMRESRKEEAIKGDYDSTLESEIQKGEK